MKRILANMLRSRIRLWEVTLWCGLAASILATATAASPQTTADVSQTDRAGSAFVAEVLANFDRWDGSHQGEITRQDTERLTLDPTVKVRAAAAIACLEWSKRKYLEQSPRFTKQFFMQYDQGLRAGQKMKPNFDRQFEDFVRKLGQSSQKLFENRPPDRDAMHQGKTGDCFFIAVLGSMVTVDPSRITKLITEEDHGYEVRFAKTKVHIKPLTDTEICLSGFTVDNGLWLPVLEKAYGTLHLQQEHVRADTEEPTDALMGGRSGPSIELFTGHKVKTLHFSAKNEGDERTHTELREALKRLVNSNRVATAGTGDRSQNVGNLEPHHGYAVLTYDPKQDLLTLWNPWGEDYSPKGPAGPQNGYPTKKGVFLIPLKEFVHVYQHISVETDADA